jgi:hypothetical protein
MIDKNDLEQWFTYHAPTEEQKVSYQRIREAAKDLSLVILEECPHVPDTSAAIRKVREAVATANAAIACGPTVGV